MTRIEFIMKFVQDRMASGHWAPGAKIWSIRAAASALNVSKNTVAEAYDRLAALGHLDARPGSGYYVPRQERREAPPKAVSVAYAVDTVSLLREQLVRHYEVRVGEGRPPHAWDGRLDFRPSSLAASSAQDRDVHGYGNPWGFRRLREYLALTFAERGIDAGPDQILTTVGANHALDLVVRQLLEPGDVVLVDSPGYYPLFAKLHLSGVRMIGVRRLEHGPDIGDLQAKAAQFRPKLFFTQSLAHNPTGSTLTLPVAYRVLQAANQHNFNIVEDDPFADIVPAAAPRLAALDQLERVIYVGTFSKTLSAGLRVGYLAANPELTAALCDLKMLTIASSADYVERMLYEFITSGQYRKHLRKLRSRVTQATEESLDVLEQLGLEVFCRPQDGGFYLWAYLAAGEDERQLVEAASHQSIFIAPGSLFSPDRVSERPGMRLNIAYTSHPKFVAFMRDRMSGRGC